MHSRSDARGATTDAPGFEPGRWKVDPQRSTVSFTVRHLMVATVHGAFERFEAVLETDDVGLVRATGVVHATSLGTGEPKRDEVVLGPAFLDGEGHPEIRFASREVRHDASGAVRVTGDLTIKGVTRPVVLTGTATGGDGGETVTISARGRISRSQFGVTGAGVLEGSGAVVSDSVGIVLEVSAVRIDDEER